MGFYRVDKMKKRTRKLKIVYETVPLSGGFMLTAMLGFIVVTVYTMSGRLDAAWGFAFDAAFLIMFIASILSVTPIFPAEMKR